MKKYSKSFERDWDFYFKNKEKFNFCGEDVIVKKHCNGASAKEAFFLLDSKGIEIETYEPDLLKSIIICKKAINLQIKMWVDGFADMMEPINYYLESFIEPPFWVEKALVNQVMGKTFQAFRKNVENIIMKNYYKES